MPPPLPPRKTSVYPNTPPPPLPPRSSRPTTSVPYPPTTPASPGASYVAEWGPFFYEDTSPTQLFLSLIDAIFAYLDHSSTGYLTPEVHSRFLDDLGFIGQENTWKSNLKETLGQSMEDMADKALKDVYDLFSIDHILHARTQRTAAGPSPLDPLYRTIFGSAATPALIASFTPSLGSGGVMPLLTRKGFVDIMSLEILYDPSKQWGNMSRLLRKYDLPAYRGWGDLPRSVLPEYPDQRSIQRVKMASAASQAKLEQLQASLQIRARGRQNALDLIDGPRYRYTYY